MPNVIRKLDDRLFIIGVAHVLPRSAAEVRKTIVNERPDIVAVELDPVRYFALTQKKKPDFLDAMRSGPNLFILSALMYLIQGKFSRQTGMVAGEEMLTAVKYAKEIGAQIELIDRHIGITLQRLINRISWSEKLRFFMELVFGLVGGGKKVELDRLTDEKIVDELLKEFKRISTTAYDVLITERDSYMSSKLATFSNSGKKVACVVGAGHVPGIYDRVHKLFTSDWQIEFDYSAGS